MPAQERFVAWMSEHVGFNPRAQGSSDALSEYVLADLQVASPEIGVAISDGSLGVKKTADVQVGLATRNVDLVMRDTTSSLICVAVENKSIMTAHGKARKNRFGDIIAYCSHVHQNRPECIAGAIMVINTSATYENPDGFAKGLQRPKFNMAKIVPDTVALFAGIPLRELPEQSFDRPEALCIMLVNYDGVSPASLVGLAPNVADTLSYPVFVQRIARLYRERFSGKRQGAAGR